jgi:hypothetical protein
MAPLTRKITGRVGYARPNAPPRGICARSRFAAVVGSRRGAVLARPVRICGIRRRSERWLYRAASRAGA